MLGFLVFLIPGAIVTGQLGRMFPGEGSIYLWTNKAFGSFWGFFAGFCAWWPGVLVMVATGTIVFSFLGFVFPDSIGTLDIRVQGIVITAFIVFSAVTNPLDFSAYAPSASTGLNFTNWTFFWLVILALLGVEVPLNMGVEIKDARSITRYLVFGSLAVMIAYLLATFGVMVA